jgi:hypothetical protein
MHLPSVHSIFISSFFSGRPINDVFYFVGGLEGAIVVWQLDTWKRRFKPRMGSPLLFFAESPDSSISCVSVPFTF